MLRRRGSATALKASEVVVALGMAREYIPIWEYVKGGFFAVLQLGPSGLRLFAQMLWHPDGQVILPFR